MSVLVCGRRDCKNTTCNRLILNGAAYICADCYLALCESKKTWPIAMTALEVFGRIVDFMQTSVGNRARLNKDQIDEEFHRLTGNLD